MKMIDIPQISHLEKLVALTRLYLELRLPLAGALRAATADLQMERLPDATQQWSSASRLSGNRYIHVVGLNWSLKMGRWITMKSPRDKFR
jgi:hypothetical protein